MLALLGRQLTQLGIIGAATSHADALKVQNEDKRLNTLWLRRLTVMSSSSTFLTSGRIPELHINISLYITENQ